MLGRSEFIRAARRADFVAFLDTHYRRRNVAIVGTGDVEHAAFRDWVGEHFAGLPDGGRPAPPEPARWVGGYYADRAPRFERGKRHIERSPNRTRPVLSPLYQGPC